MRKTEIIKTAKTFNFDKNTSTVIVSTPRIDGCDNINGFYRRFTEKIILFAENSAKKGRITPVNIRVLPTVRYSGEKRTDITFDIIISGGGRLLSYKRVAQRWNTESERLLPSEKHGEETFFNGSDNIIIRNHFGKITPRRISDYVSEEKIKAPEKSEVKRGKRANN